MKILFVPHVPRRDLINRVYEFAYNADQLFLSWHIQNDTFGLKVASQLKSLCQGISLRDNILRMPLLFRPESIGVRFNTAMLNRIVKRYGIDVVVNANAWMFDVEAIRVPVVYDLVDDWLTPNPTIGVTPKRVEKIKRDLQHCVGVITVSKELETKVKPLNPCTMTVENGVYIDRFTQAVSLKERYGLIGKKVFGYIGGVDEWTGIDKACEAFMRIKDDTNAMMIVGDSASAFFRDLKKRYGNTITFVGQVPPKLVGDYFKTIDIGLIPFELNDFTHNAFPIKAIEYGLAGANVLATPLRVLQEKRFPFIRFSPIETFAQAMATMTKEPFRYDFSRFDWRVQTDKLVQFVKLCSNETRR